MRRLRRAAGRGRASSKLSTGRVRQEKSRGLPGASLNRSGRERARARHPRASRGHQRPGKQRRVLGRSDRHRRGSVAACGRSGATEATRMQHRSARQEMDARSHTWQSRHGCVDEGGRAVRPVARLARGPAAALLRGCRRRLPPPKTTAALPAVGQYDCGRPSHPGEPSRLAPKFPSQHELISGARS